jgi:hypothetical protein
VLRASSGQTSLLPGTHPALGPLSVAWATADGQVAVAARSSLAVELTLPAADLNALALSDAWLVYRSHAQGGADALVAVPLATPAHAPIPIASAAAGVIGRPSLDGSTLVYSLGSPRHSAIVSRNLLTGAVRVLRSSGSGIAFANPSLLHGRLLYERFDRCSQELRVGSPRGPRHDRVLLRRPSVALRDHGYQPGYEHAYNGASLCANRSAGHATRTRLGSTALAPGVAYVTEISSDPFDARIVAVAR